ncbi:hypothetical protein NST62_09725 [Ureibacillus sp. FSL K6-8385]|uniref:Uncharacterized protein n=1 Tax=Ureibacillus terrenus TaxID=118246 RepID=A0A540V0N1_9BACL|nr:hypothetical protein [Ureibacillus terrenus]MED3662354.1 hypothetical protein [Ureibacillus terrenus]MED3763253.1 hypothetical protein [Ureibacillus terrenus]TQE90309.1 hypothetical protein FKZ59_10785 [Ureibacillus terrenus]
MDKLWTYVWRILWIFGLFILAIVSMDMKQQISENLHYDNIHLFFWYIFICRIFWGIYLALICIKSWNIYLNGRLFICVFLPCFVFSLILPVSSITTGTLPFGIWFIKVYSTGLVEVAAGLSLMFSIFNGEKDKKQYV